MTAPDPAGADRRQAPWNDNDSSPEHGAAFALSTYVASRDLNGARQFVHQLEEGLGSLSVNPWRMLAHLAELGIRRPVPAAGPQPGAAAQDASRPPMTAPDWSDPRTPECQAAMWGFLREVREGTAAPGPDDFNLACAMAELWRQREVMLTSLTRGISPAEADVLVAESVAQRHTLHNLWIAGIPPVQPPRPRAEG